MEQIKYYREVLDAIKESLPKKKSRSYRLTYILVEKARFNLGNMLKFINKEPSVYRKATLDRLNGDSDYIPPEQDKNNNFTIPEFDTEIKYIDYIREVLLAMFEELGKTYYKNNEVIIDDIYFKLFLDATLENLITARNYGGLVLRDIANEST